MLHARMLRYLDEVARSGSIRRAAARLNVASSAVNRQILDLEADLGVLLFERLPRSLRLTSAGEILVAHVRRTLADYREIEGRLGALKGLHGGEVVLVTMNGLAGGVVPRAVAAFCARFPAYQGDDAGDVRAGDPTGDGGRRGGSWAGVSFAGHNRVCRLRHRWTAAWARLLRAAILWPGVARCGWPIARRFR